MSFRKVAQVEHLGSFTVEEDGMTRVAQLADDAQSSYYLDGSAKVDVRGILTRVADRYAISANPADYVFEAIRANTTNVFNDNGDGFEREELLRFDPRLKTAVYLTYREKPHHVNHRTENAKRARGVILDAHYNTETTPLAECPGCQTRTAERNNRDKSGIHCKKCGSVVNDEFVEILVAIDSRKDPLFAKGVKSGQLRFGSMGCTCSETSCNVCGNIARTRAEFCAHIASHKNSLWARERANGEWQKTDARKARREFDKRGMKFQTQDLVSMRASDGYEVRKSAEWCRGVEYDEYSRVHMPADPKAEQTEVLNRAASSDDPTPDDLRAETVHLVAAAGLNDRKRKRKSATRTAMKFTVLRVDGDPLDTYAAESLEQAMAMAAPDEGASVEVAEVEAEDAGAARLLASDADFRPHAAGHDVDGDVTININDGPEGPSVDMDDPLDGGEPSTIEDFTEQELEPAMDDQMDEEFSPEELGVMPAGASKEAATMFESSYADWKVSVTPRGSAQVMSPRGPVMVIKAKKDNPNESERLAFGREVIAHLSDHGLYNTVKKYDAAFHAKFASVVDGVIDDMKGFEDKNTKSDIASGGADDMGLGEERGKHVDDIHADADSDMSEARMPMPSAVDEGRMSDHEKGNQDDAPESALQNEGSDMREPRNEKSMSDSALDNAVSDRAAALLGQQVAHTESGRLARVASFNAEAQSFDLINEQLQIEAVPQADLLAQWKQLDQAPQADMTSRLAEAEKRHRAWAKAEIERAVAAERARVFRALRIAASRQAVGLERSLLKEAVATELVNDKVVGHDAVSQAPLEYRGMSDELAIHLAEAAFSNAAAAETDAILRSASALLRHDDSYLKSAEADLKRVAHRVPVVTAASMVSDLDREAEDLRRQVTAGNMELSPSASQTASQSGDARGGIRTALGATRAAARQFRH